MSNRTWKGLAAGVLAVGVAVAGVVPSASGTTPLPRDSGLLDTAVPAGVRIGAPYTNFTVTVVTGAPMSEMKSLIVDERGTQVGVCFAETWETGRGRDVFKPWCGIYADALTHWGQYRLLHRAISWVEDIPPQPIATGSSVVEVKAHSMLGLAVGRDGATTRLRGSARAYHSVEDRYVGWPGRQVSVQRRDGDTWVQVAAATTDARGNFATSTPGLPAGTRLRAVVTDGPTIWGAVSATLPA